MPRKAPLHDYTAVKQEYITTDVSLNELARRLGISNSTIAERARKEEWKLERDAYRSAVTTKTYEKVADKVATERSAIETERISVLRATLRQYAKQMIAGEIAVSPKDALEASKALREWTGEGTGPETEGEIVVPVGREIPSEWLRRVLEIARDRGSAAGGVGGDRGAGTKGARIN